MSKFNRTPEEAKHIRIVQEYTELVTQTPDYLGLCGNQPTLTKIREAYQSDQISDTDLALVLNNIAITLQGEPEAFANQKEAMKYMFKDTVNTTKLNPVTLSVIEQAAAIQDIMGDELKKKKYSGPRKKAVKKKEAINVSALPSHLQHLAR